MRKRTFFNESIKIVKFFLDFYKSYVTIASSDNKNIYFGGFFCEFEEGFIISDVDISCRCVSCLWWGKHYK